MNAQDNHINYVEFKANDLEKIKNFYSKAFGWTFTDYGPTYVAFSESGLLGGFEKTDEAITNGALVVLYHQDLGAIKAKIIEAEGKISKDIFEFPGGRRFHFIDPSGKELAIWSDKRKSLSKNKADT
jgi:predicted enzyme related to lactoylglutathione lyase